MDRDTDTVMDTDTDTDIDTDTDTDTDIDTDTREGIWITIGRLLKIIGLFCRI